MTQETPVPQEQPEEEELGGCALPLGCILLIGVALIGLSIFSIPIFNALYGIVFPPAPPLPSPVTEIEKTVLDHGVEETRYTTSLNICQAILFYEEIGTCEHFWEFCDGESYNTMPRSFTPYAECTGITPAGTYGIMWTVVLDVLYPPEQTAFTISHEVLWGGMPLPTSTATIPD